MSDKKCPCCGAIIDFNSTECRYCGEVINEQPHQYQANNNQNTQYQANNNQNTQYQNMQYQTMESQMMYSPTGLPVERKSKIKAGILAIFLGCIGAHKFYLGNTRKGVLYLLFCWTYIPGIIGVIEGIIYLTSSEEKFYDKYVKR